MGNQNTALTTLDNGAVVPVDEPAVAAARAQHLAAKAAANTAAPVSYSAPYSSAPAATAPYSGPLNQNTALKTLDNGAIVPVDEPAVAAARVQHFAAKAAANTAAPAPYSAPYAPAP